MKGKRILAVGDIIVPYQKGHPICLFDNTTDSGDDTFIRAKFHAGLEVWFSEIDSLTNGDPSTPKDPRHWKSQGAVIFLAEEQIQVNYGVVIRRVNKAGTSAHGKLVKLPDDATIKYPYDVDVGPLFRPIGE